MKIGIDARLIRETGVGRYITNLINELSKADQVNDYIVFLRKKDFDSLVLPGEHWSKRLADVPWHTVTEQILMPFIFQKEGCDLIHIPYFNAPVFYPGKFIVTIHDLTILHFDTGRASTLPYWKYKLRRIGYGFILHTTLRRASHIIAVSEAVKDDIVESFHVVSGKISVTYEGVDSVFTQKAEQSEVTPPVPGRYFLYVGNAFPHKNVERMIEAYHEYVHSTENPVSLVLVGPLDFFYTRLEESVKSRDFGGKLKFLHEVDDQILHYLYSHATALLFPSRMEGFGLPAIEALSSGTRVIVSDIPVFHEILGDMGYYCDTTNTSEIVKALKSTAKEQHNREVFRKKVIPLLQKYSWESMADQTLGIYNNISTLS